MTKAASGTDSAAPRVPAHVAIIMDGNGRWAQARGLPRTAGHKKGAEALRELLQRCHEFGVRHLTIYAFSSENWTRPASEVNDLMDLLRYYLKKELASLNDFGTKLKIIGDRSLLSPQIRKEIEAAEAATANNDRFELTVALSYGSRSELVQAARKLATAATKGEISADEIDDAMFERELYTHGTPNPDLLIRTGGEQRLSNFLLWQSAYTEFYFTDVFWPDFSVDHFRAALDEYARRERRYGNTRAASGNAA